jgi:hypothetical protein
MAGPNYVLDKGFKAAAAIGIYRLVVVGASEQVTQASSPTANVLYGVSQEEIAAADATSGRIVNVRLAGISRCISGGPAITAGVPVTTDAVGRVVAAASTNLVVGYALQAVAAASTGQHIDVLVTNSGIF